MFRSKCDMIIHYKDVPYKLIVAVNAIFTVQHIYITIISSTHHKTTLYTQAESESPDKPALISPLPQR